MMKGPRDSVDGSSSHAAMIGSFIGMANLTSRNEREVDFSEYEWMGHEMEEFDRKVGLTFNLSW